MFAPHLQVNFVQAMPLVVDAIQAKVVPFLHGSPAIGKSALVHLLAERYNLCIIDVRLSQCDPVDLNGFPMVDSSKNLAHYVPMDLFPLESTELPINSKTGKKYAGWVLFLDEMNSAPLSVQAAAYKVVLDRQVGMFKLHKQVAIICAGNLDTDGAITNPMSTAMISRLVHLHVREDLAVWVDWAEKQGFDTRLTSFLQFRPACFYTFDPANPERVYAAPRPWEFANRFLKLWENVSKEKMPLLAGTVSEGVAVEFRAFCALRDNLPSLYEISQKPDDVRVPADPGTLYAMTGALAEYANLDNILNLLKYIDRMPAEHQIITMKSLIRRKPDLKSNGAINQWAIDHADLFF
jgi:hypothetical protein